MTTEEFNNKYSDYLEKGFYGLEIGDSDVIKYLDEKFQEFIKIPNFKYFQIKLKFGSSRFYTKELSIELNSEVEQAINLIINNKK